MLRLNEVIRRGCALAPKQVYYVPTDGDGTACIVGAAWLGAELPQRIAAEGFKAGALLVMFPELNKPCRCPLDCVEYVTASANGLVRNLITTLYNTMVHLNNDHRWSREAIAEWADPRPELHLSIPQEGHMATSQEVPHANA